MLVYHKVTDSKVNRKWCNIYYRVTHNTAYHEHMLKNAMPVFKKSALHESVIEARRFPSWTTEEVEELRLDCSVLVFSHILPYNKTDRVWDEFKARCLWHLMQQPNIKHVQMSRRETSLEYFKQSGTICPSYYSADNKIRNL